MHGPSLVFWLGRILAELVSGFVDFDYYEKYNTDAKKQVYHRLLHNGQNKKLRATAGAGERTHYQMLSGRNTLLAAQTVVWLILSKLGVPARDLKRKIAHDAASDPKQAVRNFQLRESRADIIARRKPLPVFGGTSFMNF